MAGDLDMFRDFYPQVIYWTDADFHNSLKASLERSSENNDEESIKSYYHNLAKDAKRIRDGVLILAWPEAGDKMLKRIKEHTVEICLTKIAQISRIAEAQNKLATILKTLGTTKDEWFTQVVQEAETSGITMSEDEFFYIKKVTRNWEDKFLNIPAKKILAATNWQRPFDAIDAELSESNFSVPDTHLEQMHNWIVRGHSWFGVGEWNIANRHYLNSLTLAIATNNIDAIEAITRFLIDNYIASRNYQYAINIANDFINSPGYRKTNMNYMTRQMLESIAIGLAMENKMAECQKWLGKIPELCETTSDPEVKNWKISILLIDVYSYKKYKWALTELNNAINVVTKLLAN